MSGAAEGKKQGGNGKDRDEDSDLRQSVAALLKKVEKDEKGITTMTENIKPITITNVCQADDQKKTDSKSTKDSAGSSGAKKSCKHAINPNIRDLCAQKMQKQIEEEVDAEDVFAEAAKKGDVSR